MTGKSIDVSCFTVSGLLRCAAVSGQYAAFGYSSGVISIIDIRTGKVMAWWKGHDSEVLQVSLSFMRRIL